MKIYAQFCARRPARPIHANAKRLGQCLWPITYQDIVITTKMVLRPIKKFSFAFLKATPRLRHLKTRILQEAANTGFFLAFFADFP